MASVGAPTVVSRLLLQSLPAVIYLCLWSHIWLKYTLIVTLNNLNSTQLNDVLCDYHMKAKGLNMISNEIGPIYQRYSELKFIVKQWHNSLVKHVYNFCVDKHFDDPAPPWSVITPKTYADFRKMSIFVVVHHFICKICIGRSPRG